VDINLSKFIKFLKCPITGESLKEMNSTDINKMNKQVAQKELFFFDKKLVEKEIVCALVNESKSFAFLVDDNIPILLSMHAISLNENNNNFSQNHMLKDERFSLKNFYDEIGWKSEDGDSSCYADAKLFEDLRDLSKKYISRANSRVSNIFNYSGEYFLDVASGPLQYDDYLHFSKNFKIRVCVDISIVALKAARKRLKENGIYILADITNLPFQEQSFDAAISLHTIYHVPANLQKNAFMELQRVLKCNSKCAVVYSWGSQSILMKFFMAPFRILSLLKNAMQKILSIKGSPPVLYFAPQKIQWIRELSLERTKIDILVWRSLSVPFMKLFIHKILCGKLILLLISKLEDKFPHLLGKIGQYPLIVIKKEL